MGTANAEPISEHYGGVIGKTQPSFGASILENPQPTLFGVEVVAVQNRDLLRNQPDAPE